MKPITITEAAKACNGRIINNSDKLITGVYMDSRIIEEGNLFVAIKGERVDGHDFIKQVFDKGASCVVCDHVPEGITGSCIVVDDTVKALQDMAEYYRLMMSVKVVGITGSVGKTSTKEIVSSVLSEKYKVHKTSGNHNNEIGLPLTVFEIEEDDDIAVLEMGISDFGEMRVLSKVAHPDICVMTNIGQSHLEALKTRDGILKAKSEIFEYMNPEGTVFVNGDDDKLITIKEVNGKAPVHFGFSASNYSSVKVLHSGIEGSEMEITLGKRSFLAKINIPGKHMALNAACAAAVGEHLGLSEEEIIKGLDNAKTVAGRCNLIKFGEGYIIDDCYNAAPSSMKAALDTLVYANGKKIAVLGDMLELGDESSKMHFEVGEYAASLMVDTIICIGDKGKDLYEGVTSIKNPANKELRAYHYGTLDEFLKVINEVISPGDNVLLKASNGMDFKRIKEALA